MPVWKTALRRTALTDHAPAMTTRKEKRERRDEWREEEEEQGDGRGAGRERREGRDGKRGKRRRGGRREEVLCTGFPNVCHDKATMKNLICFVVLDSSSSGATARQVKVTVQFMIMTLLMEMAFRLIWMKRQISTPRLDQGNYKRRSIQSPLP